MQEELGNFYLLFLFKFLDALDSDELDLNLKGGSMPSHHDEVVPQDFQVLEEYVSGQEDDGENHL